MTSREVIGTRANTQPAQRQGGDDLVPLEALVCQTPGAHPITSVDELRCEAFDSDEELDEFLAFVADSRHVDLA